MIYSGSGPTYKFVPDPDVDPTLEVVVVESWHLNFGS
jgi:hypothetical protein